MRRRHKDGERRGRGDGEMGRWGDRAMERRVDRLTTGMGRQVEMALGSAKATPPRLTLTPSPRLNRRRF